MLELICILVLVAIPVLVGTFRFSVSDSKLFTSRDAVVAALSHAQQVAMARDSSSNPVTVVISGNSIDVRENGVSVGSLGASYPIAFPSGVTVSSGTGTLSYDKMGRTTFGNIVLNGQMNITVDASGYAY